MVSFMINIYFIIIKIHVDFKEIFVSDTALIY